jgi:cell division septation protein DedD
MSRNAEGEFELVLGNKQLLSLFFLVVVLFAVFFSLGYMVGRSVGPPLQAAQPPGPGSAPVTEPPPPRPGKALEEKAAGLPAAVEETQPARSDPPAPAPKTELAATPPESAPALVSRQLHLQIAAVRLREDAEALVESMRKKGYRGMVNDEGADGLHRVLIGPFSSEREAQEMKAQLEKDGHKSILKRP